MTKNWKHPIKLYQFPSYPIRFFNLSPPSLVKSSSAPSVVSAPCLDDHAFFSDVVKGNERLLDSQPVKCDVNVIFYVFFCFVLIRFLYPFFVSNVAVNNILTEFCLTRRGTATALAPACRCPSCPSCPAVDAVGGERAAAEHGAFGAFEYGAECRTQSELFWRFFKVFFVSESR